MVPLCVVEALTWSETVSPLVLSWLAILVMLTAEEMLQLRLRLLLEIPSLTMTVGVKEVPALAAPQETVPVISPLEVMLRPVGCPPRLYVRVMPLCVVEALTWRETVAPSLLVWSAMLLMLTADATVKLNPALLLEMPSLTVTNGEKELPRLAAPQAIVPEIRPVLELMLRPVGCPSRP